MMMMRGAIKKTKKSAKALLMIKKFITDLRGADDAAVVVDHHAPRYHLHQLFKAL
jgi:hypothetical protein